MNGRPVILLNMSYKHVDGRDNDTLIHQYAERIYAAGGAPLLMPVIEDTALIRRCLSAAQGVLLIGGKDYPPEYYGEVADFHTDLSRLHPGFDPLFGREALAAGLPVLGICAGCQLLAILSGGTLIQHLPNADEAHKNGLIHQAQVTKCGWLSRILELDAGAGFTVNSFHHQAVRQETLGKNFAVTARAFDGTVEAIEMLDEAGQISPRMVLGVQFHPERMDDLGPAFFEMLVSEAGKTCRP